MSNRTSEILNSVLDNTDPDNPAVRTTAQLVVSDINIGNVDVLSIAAGDNNIGNVDIVSLPALPAGNNNIGDVDIASLPTPATLATCTTGQVTATTTSGSTSFVPALSGRKSLTITNASPTVGVFVGPSGVTAANGHYLAPGASQCYEASQLNDGGAPLAYCVITAASTALCTYEGLS